MTSTYTSRLVKVMLLSLLLPLLGRAGAQDQRRTIDIVADRDSRYKIDDAPHPVLLMKAGEHVTLRITARKAKGSNRDGAVHGFALLRSTDNSKVPGWDLLLKPGTQDFELDAPDTPGEYKVVCTVICSADHEGMNMKVIVSE